MTLSVQAVLGLFALFTILTIASCADPALKPIQASDVLDQIERGQTIYYEGVQITDLHLSALSDPDVTAPFYLVNSSLINASFDGIKFNEGAVFWGSTLVRSSFNRTGFEKLANFNNATFNEASFREATFYGPAVFNGAIFQNNASFVDSSFQKEASFSGIFFGGDADFNYSSFGDYAYFPYSFFQGRALFSDVSFVGGSDFSFSQFGDHALFFKSEFSDYASFWGAIFNGPAMFGMTRFGSLTAFNNCSFLRGSNFNLAKFDDAIDFEGSDFQGTALFGLSQFSGHANFRNTSFHEDLNLKGSKVSSLVLQNTKFDDISRIILNDSQFSNLRAPWSEIRGHAVYEPGAYLALIENYRRMGWAEDEDDCYYQYRWLYQAQKPWGWSKLIDMLAWASCGYGVKPSFAVIWSILTIFAFALIFWGSDGIRRSSRPFQGWEIDPVPERATLRNALFFSTMIFLSQGPIDFLPVGRKRYLVIIEGILGWLLLALFLVTLGRIMIR
jgi:uncharacterized protein YjbI with pentapeptide repeats